MKKLLFLLPLMILTHLCFAYPIPKPFPPFRIADNLYFVGNTFQASYLIVTSKGNILINSDVEENVPMLKASIEKLGFKFNDIKILLISHAHSDHAAGSAMIKEKTGAVYMVMEQDVSAVESGGKTDFQYGEKSSSPYLYPPTKVDVQLHDGDKVTLGDTVLIAHLTPGHSKGSTTWTMHVTENGKKYNAVITGSTSVNPGYQLVHNTEYPNIAEDYKHTFQLLKSLPCDIFLGAHGGFYALEKKYGLMKTSTYNPYIDPAGYKKYVTHAEHEFYQEFEKQRSRHEVKIG